LKLALNYDIKARLPSGYRAVIGHDYIECGESAKKCRFKAIEIISISENGKEEEGVPLNIEA
jgi:hypothetical protein